MNIVFSNLQKDMFRRFLRQSPSREAIVELLDEADQGSEGNCVTCGLRIASNRPQSAIRNRQSIRWS